MLPAPSWLRHSLTRHSLTLAFWGGLSCSAVPGRYHNTLTLGLSLSLSLSLRLSPSLSLRLRLSLRLSLSLSLSLSLGLRLSPMMLTRHFGWSSKTMMVTNTMDVRQHGQSAPFGRTRARPLRLRRAHLAALCGAALPEA